MKKLILNLGLILASTISNAQTTTFAWAKGMGGTQQDFVRSIAVDATGNVYTTGSFQGICDFDPGPGVYTLTTNGGGAVYDVFVSKLDASGNFVWAKRMGSTGDDKSYAIGLDASGNVYTTGYYTGIADFDPGPAVFNLNPGGGTEIFISKLDASGNFVWAKAMGGGNTVYAVGYSMKLDASGNIFTSGGFQSTVDFDPGPGTFTLSAPTGTNDIYVSKLDASGNFVWAKAMGGSGDEIANSITLDGSGNIYTTGYFQGTADFDPGAGTFTLTAAGSDDIFISKLDASGNFVWANKMGGNFSDVANSIQIDGSGNVYTTGYFTATADLDPGPGTFTLMAIGADIFISKLNSSGNFVWAKNIGGGDDDKGYAISLDASGDVYTTGAYRQTVDFDPGAGVFVLTASLFGQDEMFVSKLDALGNFAWAKSLGNTGPDAGQAITIDATNNVFVAGYYSGTVDFDPTPAVSNLTSVGISGVDVCVFKWGQCNLPTTPTNTTPIANQTLCSNSSATLSALSGTNSINWFATPAGTVILGTGTVFVTPTLSAGTYTYYAEAQSCAPSASRTAVTITVSTCTGLAAVNTNELMGMNLYPNPSSGSLNIELKGAHMNALLQITDVSGKQLLGRKIENEKTLIDVSGLSPGIYFVSLKQGEMIKTLRFIKEQF